MEELVEMDGEWWPKEKVDNIMKRYKSLVEAGLIIEEQDKDDFDQDFKKD